jgi:hypothetical protein
VCLASACPLAPAVLAHELRPAYLDLRQRSLDTYDVLWKVPARVEGLRLALDARFPDDCQHATPLKTFAGGAAV